METEMTLSWLSDLGKSVFGSMDGLFYTLVAFVVIDYITGVCVAIHNKQLSSDVGAHGIAKHHGKRGKGGVAAATKAAKFPVPL